MKTWGTTFRESFCAFCSFVLFCVLLFLEVGNDDFRVVREADAVNAVS